MQMGFEWLSERLACGKRNQLPLAWTGGKREGAGHARLATLTPAPIAMAAYIHTQTCIQTMLAERSALASMLTGGNMSQDDCWNWHAAAGRS